MLKSSAWALAVVASVASLGCDALRNGANPEVPLWVHHASGSLRVAYKEPLVAASRRTGEPYERGQAELDTVHRRVFVGSSDRGMYAIQADTGETLWRFETMGFVQTAPLYVPEEDVLYFGSNDGALYKVEAKSGKLLWRFSSNAEILKRPVLQ